MPILDVIEVLTESDQSWEDAAQTAVELASRTVRGIRSIYIKEFEATVENDKISRYRINANLSLVVEGDYGSSAG